MRRVLCLAFAVVLLGSACGGGTHSTCYVDGPDGLHGSSTNGACRAPSAGQVADRIPVGKGPDGLALGAGDLWIANFQGQGVTRVHPETGNVVASIPTGESPVRIVEGFGSMWVANYGSDTVARIDPKTNKVTARIDVGVAFQPDGIAVANGRVWVGSASDGSVTRIDPATNRIAGKVLATGSDASEISAAFGSVWVSCYRDGVVRRLDPQSGRVVAKFEPGGGPLLATPVGDQLWLGLYDEGAVVRIDPQSNKILGRNALDNGVQGIATMDGSAWVAVESDNPGFLYKLDPETGLADGVTTVGVQPKMLVPAVGSLWFPLFGSGQLARFQPKSG